jgi:hypothetical protein
LLVEASYTRQKAGILADAKEQVVRLPITHKSFGKIGNPRFLVRELGQRLCRSAPAKGAYGDRRRRFWSRASNAKAPPRYGLSAHSNTFAYRLNLADSLAGAI